MQYLMPNPVTDVLQPPIPDSPYKSDRGFHHPVIAKLLCPVSVLDDFNLDPEECVPFCFRSVLPILTRETTAQLRSLTMAAFQ